MSNPISNFIKVVSNKETFETIANLLIDEEREETTYSKFWPSPEGLSEREEYEWRMANYQCTKGVCIIVDHNAQTIWFETNYDPAVLIVERIASLFPDARIEYGYDLYDDDIHEVTDTYENGVLVNREDTIVDDYDEYEDEDEDEI